MAETHVSSASHLQNLLAALAPPFEGIENNDNWEKRQAAIIALRSITKGSAPQDFRREFASGIASLMDGIIKAVVSLRTSLSIHGLELVQELASCLETDLDPLVDMLTTPVVKICGHSKAMTSEAADRTISKLFTHVTFHQRFVSFISEASGEKNAKLRACAMGWIMSLIATHSKGAFERANSIDVFVKIVQKGLTDAQNDVRARARDAYWTLQSKWPGRAEGIMDVLNPTARNLLLKHNNENAVQPQQQQAQKPASAPAGATRPSLKEAKMAQRKAKAVVGDENIILVPQKKAAAAPLAERPASSAAVRSMADPAQTGFKQNSMASAPKRPIKPRAVESRLFDVVVPSSDPARPASARSEPPAQVAAPAKPPIVFEAPAAPTSAHARQESASTHDTTRSAAPSKPRAPDATISASKGSDKDQARAQDTTTVSVSVDSGATENFPASSEPQQKQPVRDYDQVAKLAATNTLSTQHVNDIEVLRKISTRIDSQSVQVVHLQRIGKLLAGAVDICDDPNSPIMFKQIGVIRRAVERYPDSAGVFIVGTVGAIKKHLETGKATDRSKEVLKGHLTFFRGACDPLAQRASVLSLTEQVRKGTASHASKSIELEVWRSLIEGPGIQEEVSRELLSLLREGLTRDEGTMKRQYIELGVCLFRSWKNEKEFWDGLKGAPSESKALLLYYIAKRA